MPTLIEGPYFRDIAAQPQALQATWQSLVPSQSLLEWGKALMASQAPLVLTGMGASLSALVPLQLKLIEAGLCPVLIETSELIHHAWPLVRPGATVIAVSQSGRSAETVRLLERVPAGVRLIGVTNDATSDLATRASLALVTSAGPEATVSCKTYVSTLMALEWLGAQLVNEDLQVAHEELAQASPLVATVVGSLRERVDALTAILVDTALIYFAGRGASLGSATCAGLITKEAVHFPAEGLSSAAFRHGPLEMVGPQVFLVVFEGTGDAAALNKNLVGEVVRRGGRAALCGPNGEGPFALPAGAARLLPMLEILVAQQITLALSARVGREAGKFSHASKITAVE
ncbi:MAG: SIS domain-containing protein [Deltaproteobacteria bacterium]|nr:SIS domain-containing protein [Deltaproteobacteria bacterium]